MHIHQLSAALDHKLAQLDKQLKKLEDERHPSQDARSDQQRAADLLALQQIRAKLIKSKDLAWRAHALQQANDEQGRARQRVIGLSLCAISVLGAGALVLIALGN